jgi:putative ABC transport system ATP-binding protein
MIVVRGAHRRFPMGSSQVRALQGVDLTIRAGEFVALMGASGSGKSTLLNVLGCLDRLDDGEYWLENQLVSRLSGDQLALIRNRRIGFIFQNFNLLPRLNAEDNVSLPLLYRANKTDLREQARAVLLQVGLAGRFDHMPAQLSGGERQRVAIARALVADPAILLADEPTGNLDSATGRDIMGLIAELSRQGRTILMVTHDAQVAGFAQRSIFMRDGMILSEEHSHALA